MLHPTALVVELDTSTWMSLVARVTSTLISLGALVLAALSCRRSGHADRRDKQRHDAELAADAAGKRAELVPVPQEKITRRTGEPTISITNVGPATARNVRAWLVDEHGARASSVAGDEGPRGAGCGSPNAVALPDGAPGPA